MKELVIISGKGGTGKTSFTASFATLTDQAVLADCDVDAADLHLLLHPEIQQREEFKSGATAVVNQALCTHCRQCVEVCRFDAITAQHQVDPLACEGCGVCFHICPVDAITMEENVCGEWFVSSTDTGPMAHARLGIAEENSGKLVTLVRKQAQRLAEELKKPLIIIDGPPGIGCPVISSITGTDLVLIITEPTLSGIHDLERVADLTEHFGIPTWVCVNKANINPVMTEEIEDACAERQLRFIGSIPYDIVMVKALVQQQPIVTYSHGATARKITQIWREIEEYLLQEDSRPSTPQ